MSLWSSKTAVCDLSTRMLSFEHPEPPTYRADGRRPRHSSALSRERPRTPNASSWRGLPGRLADRKFRPKIASGLLPACFPGEDRKRFVPVDRPSDNPLSRSVSLGPRGRELQCFGATVGLLLGGLSVRSEWQTDVEKQTHCGLWSPADIVV